MEHDIRNLLYAGVVATTLAVGYIGGRVNQYMSDLESVTSTYRDTRFSLSCGVARVGERMTSKTPVIHGLVSMLDFAIPRRVPTIEETSNALRLACKE